MALTFSFPGKSSSQDSPGTDRKPYAAGRFYPASQDSLRAQLSELFRSAKPRTVKNLQAVICPHAGDVFSGTVAASGINQVDPDKVYDNIFIIGSSHQASFMGASIYNKGDYLTPLGKVTVNTRLANELIKANPVFSYVYDADLNEHCLEVEVPFLQYHMKKPFKIVPIVIGSQSNQTCKRISDAIKPYFNEHNLFIISSDFSHYPQYNDAKNTDKATCDAILMNNLSIQDLSNTGMAWKLEGHVGRQCMDALEEGRAMLGETGHRDYYGNYVPSRTEVQPGSVGSPEYVAEMTERREE